MQRPGVPGERLLPKRPGPSRGWEWRGPKWAAGWRAKGNGASEEEAKFMFIEDAMAETNQNANHTK